MIKPFEDVKISIHVPAKGTTDTNRDGKVTINISIHVPAKGTTEILRDTSKIYANFNPRSREGNDAK